MSSAPATSSAEQLETVRYLVTQATQHLLGNTISVSDDDWRGPSRLPDWTRGHVATHVARHADGIRRLTEWARTGNRQEMYTSTDQRDREIDEGAGRSGLDLQVDLDTSAGRLAEAFEVLDAANAWNAIVELRDGTRVPARLLPLARLL
jgi:maleylpyruvate isomerase